MDLFIIINSEMKPGDQLHSNADNHDFKDGLFETMKVVNGQIRLQDYHFERLLKGIKELNYKMPESFYQEKIRDEIIQLCRKNNCEDIARVRLSVSWKNEKLNDSSDNFQYLIECRPLDVSVNKLNEQGLVVDIFPGTRKKIDKFSNLKSSNYLPYVMADLWAKENKLDETFILNTFDRVCESAIANVFWIKDGVVFTPPLSEGCVAGVMRRYILKNARETGFEIQEKELILSELKDADEIFLTNAIRGIRWVHQFSDQYYNCRLTKKIHEKLVKLIL